MSSREEDWERLEELLAAALERPAAERDAFLVEECGGDEELLAEARSLLAAYAGVPSGYLEPVPPSTPDAATPAPAQAPPQRLGDFELLEELGHGMAVVYRARQISLQREVALKLLTGAEAKSPRFVERFQREARAIAKLEHPHVVRVHVVGTEQGVPYFAMELVRGHDLRRELEILTSAEPSSGARALALPTIGARGYVSKVVDLVAKLADALHAAHEAGIVHRDVKPSNVLLDANGEPKLADFGIARDESLGRAERTDTVGGTAYYMSPEQARLESAARIDRRTDIYSLGVVLYELLARKRPFEGKTRDEILTKIRQQEPVPLRRLERRVPRDLAVISATAMAKEPTERYATAAALAADLRHFLAHEAIEAQPPSYFVRARRFVRRHRLAVGAAVLLVIGLVTGTLLTRWGSDRETVREAESRARSLLERFDTELTSRLVEMQRELRQLAQRDLPIDGQLSAELDRKLALARDRAAAELALQVLRAIAVPARQKLFGLDLESFRVALVRFAQLVRDFPAHENQQIEQVLDALRAPLEISVVDEAGTPLVAEISAVRLDPLTGLTEERLSIGSSSALTARLEPGYYRVHVRPPGGPAREFTRMFRLGWEEEPIRCTISPARWTSEAMVRVEGGELRIPPGQFFSPYAGQTIRVPSFWIDEAPVSIREYRAFLAATGTAQPTLWEHFPTSIDPELPAVAVGWKEARAYAEWVGKRLVSAPERELATRGAEGATWPYPVREGEDPYRGAVFAAKPASSLSFPEEAALFARFAVPVRSTPEARSVPLGLYHPLGNARDWTESLGIDNGPSGSLVPLADSRFILGGSWWAKAVNENLRSRSIRGIQASHAQFAVGFRCARSAEP
ncbi:MAG: protein kinase [Planctomycetes bacterium]|nr:protein kinase [Planctomycetota bacterium]